MKKYEAYIVRKTSPWIFFPASYKRIAHPPPYLILLYCSPADMPFVLSLIKLRMHRRNSSIKVAFACIVHSSNNSTRAV